MEFIALVRNDRLLEYGKIMPALQTANEIRFKVNLHCYPTKS